MTRVVCYCFRLQGQAQKAWVVGIVRLLAFKMEDGASDNANGGGTETAATDDLSKTAIPAGGQLKVDEHSDTATSSKSVRAEGDTVNAGAECRSKSSFTVWYLGSAVMHRLYTQSLQPWVMAEVRRKRDGIKEVTKHQPFQTSGKIKCFQNNRSVQTP